MLRHAAIDGDFGIGHGFAFRRGHSDDPAVQRSLLDGLRLWFDRDGVEPGRGCLLARHVEIGRWRRQHAQPVKPGHDQHCQRDCGNYPLPHCRSPGFGFSRARASRCWKVKHNQSRIAHLRPHS